MISCGQRFLRRVAGVNAFAEDRPPDAETLNDVIDLNIFRSDAVLAGASIRSQYASHLRGGFPFKTRTQCPMEQSIRRRQVPRNVHRSANILSTHLAPHGASDWLMLWLGMHRRRAQEYAHRRSSAVGVRFWLSAWACWRWAYRRTHAQRPVHCNPWPWLLAPARACNIFPACSVPWESMEGSSAKRWLSERSSAFS